MNILLLGNGFDLYYKLPTKYSNFLHISHCLKECKVQGIKNIGEIMSQPSLQQKDSFIKECYEEHKEVYDAVPVDVEKIRDLVSIIEKNMWFSYLLKSFDKDVGWIDFEKEIAFVISCFERGLPVKGIDLSYKSEDKDIKYVFKEFSFMIDVEVLREFYNIKQEKIKKAYCTEYPLGSGNIRVDKQKIILHLYNELVELKKALRLYLQCFVESICEMECKKDIRKCIDLFHQAQIAVTFNYTNTFEKFYSKSSVYHIHGNVNDEIVLGVNPDFSDNLETINTMFIKFKKYYQRTSLDTDLEYLCWLEDVKKYLKKYRLIIMGHSLDITDKDVVADIFENAEEIYILYHNQAAREQLISNLVDMFGKEGLDMLRKEKALTFLRIDSDLQPLTDKLREERWEEIQSNFWNETSSGEEITVI